MKWLLKHFSFSVIIFSLCLNFNAQQLKKEILYTHYDAVEYNWPAQINAIAEDSLGIKYFGTSSGVLIYNGATWKKLKTPFTVWSLVSDDNGRIFVGGENEFGQLKHGEEGELYYSSLMDLTDYETGLENQDFRHLLYNQRTVYFTSQQYMFAYELKDEKIREKYLPIEGEGNIVRSLILINNNLFVFIDNQGLYRYSSKFQKIKIHPQDTFTNNYITSGTFLDGKFLFITSKNKLYEFEQDLKISEK